MKSTPFKIPTINARLIEKVSLGESISDQIAQIWVDNKAKFVQITVNYNQDPTVVTYIENHKRKTIFVGNLISDGKPQIISMPSDTPPGDYTVGVVCSTQIHTGHFSIVGE